jgi:hypothetical protein
MAAVERSVNGKQPWRTAVEKAGAWRNYPFLSPDSFPNVESYRSAVYDLIGTWNRIKLNQDRPEYVEFRRVLVSELCENVKDLAETSDYDIVQECYKRGIKTDENGKFYREKKVVKVEREYIALF